MLFPVPCAIQSAAQSVGPVIPQVPECLVPWDHDQTTPERKPCRKGWSSRFPVHMQQPWLQQDGTGPPPFPKPARSRQLRSKPKKTERRRETPYNALSFLTPFTCFCTGVVGRHYNVHFKKGGSDEEKERSAHTRKSRNSDCWIDRIGKLSGFCSGLYGSHLRGSARCHRSGDTGSYGYRQAYRERTDAHGRKQRDRRIQFAASSGGRLRNHHRT